MLDEFSQFLFNQNSIAGWQYQNWMLVIGLPITILFNLFFAAQVGSQPSRKIAGEAAN
jgi:hypothetical protein